MKPNSVNGYQTKAARFRSIYMNWFKAARPLLGTGNEKLGKLFEAADEVILGKSQQLRLALCALLAEGHVLIEDVPGVGKTTLVKTLAALLGFQPTRIQFTNDLLPADILGNSVFDPKAQRFVFHPGPIFGQMLLADELNRATAKTQSALLQAMAERQVTVDGITHPLPHPFFVVATQNPKEQTGTYPLPESQLDRFMMRLDLGYPDRQAEAQLLKGEGRERLLEQLRPMADSRDLENWQKQTQRVTVSEFLIRYLQDLLDYTRARPRCRVSRPARVSPGFAPPRPGPFCKGVILFYPKTFSPWAWR